VPITDFVDTSRPHNVKGITLDELNRFRKAALGEGLPKNGLARLLKSFKVEPKTIRVGDKLLKGYRLSHFKDAFERYLQP
jgi:hypothetical protein